MSETTPFISALAERVLVADGAMGTTLFSLGLEGGGCPELLNVDRPDLVASVHRRFAEAGADIVLTNTFGGTASRLSLHGLQRRVRELNVAAARVARDATRDLGTLVAGSVGPTGEILAPLGSLTHDDAVRLFDEQITGLVEGGVDVVWIETISSLEELAAAVEAAARHELPVTATLSFDTAGRTMMGVSGADIGAFASAHPELSAIGANCGIGPGDAVAACFDASEVAPDVVTIAKPNCGMPLYESDRLVYPIGPEGMDDFAELALRSGVSIIGTCCGSVPEHTAVLRRAVDQHSGGSRPERQEIEQRLGAGGLAQAARRRSSRRERADRSA